MITVYSSPTCGYCHMVKQYLDSKHQPYKEIDISIDKDGAKWVIDHVGQAVTPVIDIDGTVIVGFDKDALDAAIKSKSGKY